jgi:nucleoside-diphosphate-sugar epimerase
MRVGVVGSDGFVGKAVIAALETADWGSVVPLPLSQPLGPQLRGIDCVANCVAGQPQRILRAASDLFAAAAQCDTPPLIVHVSSMTVYGSATGRVTEDSTLLADLGPYARAQLDAERLAVGYARAIRLRPGVEYGPGSEHWTGNIARCLAARRLGDLGAAGDGYCNLLFVEDLVQAILLALRQPQLVGRVFNLALPEPPTWNEYFTRFAKRLGAVPVRRISRRRLKVESKLLAPPLKVMQMTLGRAGLRTAPAITPSLVAVCRQEIRLDPSLAQAQLGVRWTPLDAGLESAAAWTRGAY